MCIRDRSLAVQYYAEPEIVANVPPNCFIPRPNVGSAVIRLTRHKEMPVEVKDPALMFKIIRASFNQRRKTLQNGLGNAPEPVSYTHLDVYKRQTAHRVNPSGLRPRWLTENARTADVRYSRQRKRHISSA